MLEILDQSTARKTRHQPKGTNKQARQTTRKEQVCRYSKQYRADQTPKEANKQAKKTQGERGTEKERRGEGTHHPPQAQRRNGETKGKKEQDQREERQQAN